MPRTQARVPYRHVVIGFVRIPITSTRETGTTLDGFVLLSDPYVQDQAVATLTRMPRVSRVVEKMTNNHAGARG